MVPICPCISTLHLFHPALSPNSPVCTNFLHDSLATWIPFGFTQWSPAGDRRQGGEWSLAIYSPDSLPDWLWPTSEVPGSYQGVSAYSSRTLYAQIRSQGGDRGKPAQNMATHSLTFLPSRCGVYVLSPWKWVGSATTRNNKTWQKWHCFSAQTGSFYQGMLRQNCSGRRRPPLKAFLTLHRSLGHSGQPLPAPFTRGQVCIAVWQLPQPSPPCFLFSLSQALPLIKSLHI